ncbi:hypothetical protein DFP72DRAFT_851156 [Ephemerocybe angulata]|uniref:Uncharacterized protein n=1 Tax=Ephemerocybe angulata TaxID=980116 RepID=A0A8H6HQB3_9AGAR|nr:hypothetical protein DFP72DRAFT_851156 [Tulosesus angulatus]
MASPSLTAHTSSISTSHAPQGHTGSMRNAPPLHYRIPASRFTLPPVEASRATAVAVRRSLKQGKTISPIQPNVTELDGQKVVSQRPEHNETAVQGSQDAVALGPDVPSSSQGQLEVNAQAPMTQTLNGTDNSTMMARDDQYQRAFLFWDPAFLFEDETSNQQIGRRPLLLDDAFLATCHFRSFNPRRPTPTNFEILMRLGQFFGEGVTKTEFQQILRACKLCQRLMFADRRTSHECSGVVPSVREPDFDFVSTLLSHGGDAANADAFVLRRRQSASTHALIIR